MASGDVTIQIPGGPRIIVISDDQEEAPADKTTESATVATRAATGRAAWLDRGDPRTHNNTPGVYALGPLELRAGRGDSLALYGPRLSRYSTREDRRRRLLTGAELVVASRERPFRGAQGGPLALEPWLEHHGIPRDSQVRVLRSIGGISVHQYNMYEFCVARVARAYRPDAYPSEEKNLRHYEYVMRDALLSAIDEARGALEAGRTPAGALEFAKGWLGESVYRGGRRPMTRMPTLPEDALRCIGDHLAPMAPAPHAEVILEASRALCERWDASGIEALPVSQVRLSEEEIEAQIAAFDSFRGDMRQKVSELEQILYAVKRRLSPVSRSWHHALKKTVSVLTSRLDDYEEHRDLLRNKKDTAHHIRVRVYGERDPAVYG